MDVVLFAAAAAIGNDTLAYHAPFSGVAGFRHCNCHVNGITLSESLCFQPELCVSDPDEFDVANENTLWKRVSTSTAWSDTFQPPNPNVPQYDETVAATFTGQLFYDFYDHPDANEDEVLRIGERDLLGWYWRYDASEGNVDSYVDPNDGQDKIVGIWWDHVPVQTVGGTPVYADPAPARDAVTLGRLRDHYTYVTAPLLDLKEPVPPGPMEYKWCPHGHCGLALIPGLPHINPPPVDKIVTFFDYLTTPARVIVNGQDFVAVRSPGDELFNVGPELSPDVKALLNTSASWLSPVETEYEVQRLGDYTHAVALSSPWTPAGQVAPIVGRKEGLAVERTLAQIAALNGEPTQQSQYLPSERSGARGLLTLTERSVYLVGGMRPAGDPAAEIWRYHLDLAAWEPLYLNGRARPMDVMAAAYDHTRGRLVVVDQAPRSRSTGMAKYEYVGGGAEPTIVTELNPQGQTSQGGSGGAQGGGQVQERRRLLLFDTHSRQSRVLAECPPSPQVTRVALVARSDGTLLHFAFRQGHDDWTAWRLELTGPDSFAYTGKLKGSGTYLDEPMSTDRGVVIPLVDGGNHRMLTITDDMLGSGSAGCNAL